MNSIRSLVTGIFLNFIIVTVFATPPDLSLKPLSYRPHRIIRPCCAFGSDLRVSIVPIYKLSEITSIGNIGPHQYLGNPGEGNGIIYSRKGGFIDLGHLRDQADWTAYLYSQIKVSQQKGEVFLNLGREGGLKTLKLNVPPDLSQSDAILLAGRIAYDLSVWHEIATWFGASSFPFVSERFSSFSIEDPYSNLLGATLGMKSIQSELPYDKAMTYFLKQTLDSLGVVANREETYLAMEAVRNIWWTRKKHLPNWRMLMERQLSVYSCQTPWLVPGWGDSNDLPVRIELPSITNDGRTLDNFYQLEFKLNGKFPVRQIFASSERKRNITQEDFGTLLGCIEKQITDYGYQYR